MHSEVQAFLALLSVEGAGYTTVNNIAEAAAAAGQRIVNLVGLPAAEVVERLGLQRGDAAYFVSRCTARDMGRAQELLEQAEAGGARAISRGHEDYPESLVSCLGSAAPPLLFCLGDSNPLREAGAAVVEAIRMPEPVHYLRLIY